MRPSVQIRSCRPIMSLSSSWPRTPGFQSGYRGSNPLRDTNDMSVAERLCAGLQNQSTQVRFLPGMPNSAEVMCRPSSFRTPSSAENNRGVVKGSITLGSYPSDRWFKSILRNQYARTGHWRAPRAVNATLTLCRFDSYFVHQMTQW